MALRVWSDAHRGVLVGTVGRMEQFPHPIQEGCTLAFELSFPIGWRGRARWYLLQWKGASMPGEAKADMREFSWRQGRDIVTLRRQEDGWRVSYSTVGRLLGPRLFLHEATHRVAKHAAFDIMARVITVCADEEEGVQTAMRAAQWMRQLEGKGAEPTRA